MADDDALFSKLFETSKPEKERKEKKDKKKLKDKDKTLTDLDDLKAKVRCTVTADNKVGVLKSPDVTADVHAYITPGTIFAAVEVRTTETDSRTYYCLKGGKGWVPQCSRKDPSKAIVKEMPNVPRPPRAKRAPKRKAVPAAPADPEAPEAPEAPENPAPAAGEAAAPAVPPADAATSAAAAAGLDDDDLFNAVFAGAAPGTPAGDVGVDVAAPADAAASAAEEAPAGAGAEAAAPAAAQPAAGKGRGRGRGRGKGRGRGRQGPDGPAVADAADAETGAAEAPPAKRRRMAKAKAAPDADAAPDAEVAEGAAEAAEEEGAEGGDEGAKPKAKGAGRGRGKGKGGGRSGAAAQKLGKTAMAARFGAMKKAADGYVPSPAAELIERGDLPAASEVQYTALVKQPAPRLQAMLKMVMLPTQGVKHQLAVRIIRHLAGLSPTEEDVPIFVTHEATLNLKALQAQEAKKAKFKGKAKRDDTESEVEVDVGPQPQKDELRFFVEAFIKKSDLQLLTVGDMFQELSEQFGALSSKSQRRAKYMAADAIVMKTGELVDEEMEGAGEGEAGAAGAEVAGAAGAGPEEPEPESDHEMDVVDDDDAPLVAAPVANAAPPSASEPVAAAQEAAEGDPAPEERTLSEQQWDEIVSHVEDFISGSELQNVSVGELFTSIETRFGRLGPRQEKQIKKIAIATTRRRMRALAEHPGGFQPQTPRPPTESANGTLPAPLPPAEAPAAEAPAAEAPAAEAPAAEAPAAEAPAAEVPAAKTPTAEEPAEEPLAAEAPAAEPAAASPGKGSKKGSDSGSDSEEEKSSEKSSEDGGSEESDSDASVSSVDPDDDGTADREELKRLKEEKRQRAREEKQKAKEEKRQRAQAEKEERRKKKEEDKKASQEEKEKAKQAKKEEQDRRQQEKQEQEREAKERKEQARLEREKREEEVRAKQREEKERKEQQRLERERQEKEKEEAEQAEKERLEREQKALAAKEKERKEKEERRRLRELEKKKQEWQAEQERRVREKAEVEVISEINGLLKRFVQETLARPEKMTALSNKGVVKCAIKMPKVTTHIDVIQKLVSGYGGKLVETEYHPRPPKEQKQQQPKQQEEPPPAAGEADSSGKPAADGEGEAASAEAPARPAETASEEGVIMDAPQGLQPADAEAPKDAEMTGPNQPELKHSSPPDVGGEPAAAPSEEPAPAEEVGKPAEVPVARPAHAEEAANPAEEAAKPAEGQAALPAGEAAKPTEGQAAPPAEGEHGPAPAEEAAAPAEDGPAASTEAQAPADGEKEPAPVQEAVTPERRDAGKPAQPQGDQKRWVVHFDANALETFSQSHPEVIEPSSYGVRKFVRSYVNTTDVTQMKVKDLFVALEKRFGPLRRITLERAKLMAAAEVERKVAEEQKPKQGSATKGSQGQPEVKRKLAVADKDSDEVKRARIDTVTDAEWAVAILTPCGFKGEGTDVVPVMRPPSQQVWPVLTGLDTVEDSRKLREILKKTSLGKAVTCMRHHQTPEIAKCAKSLIIKWKAQLARPRSSSDAAAPEGSAAKRRASVSKDQSEVQHHGVGGS